MDKLLGIRVNLSPKREWTNYLELELTCPQNGNAVRDKLLGIRVTLSPKREWTNYLGLELTCPQNGNVVRDKLLGIRVNLSPKRECGSGQITWNQSSFVLKTGMRFEKGSFTTALYIPHYSYEIWPAAFTARLNYQVLSRIKSIKIGGKTLYILVLVHTHISVSYTHLTLPTKA